MSKVLLFLAIYTCSVFGFDSFDNVDKKYKITQEIELQNIYTDKIVPHFEKQTLKYFTTKDNKEIAYKTFLVKNAKANIIISSGRTESMVKYQELIYDLNANTYSVYIHDHRGQGFSQRVAKDTQLGHVNNFFNYVEDMKQFVDSVVPKKQNRFLLAHSMGGAIASLYVEKYKEDFNGLVLSSPMHQPDLISSGTTKIVCKLIQHRKSNLNNYIIGEKSYDDEQRVFELNKLTHSSLRYDIMNHSYKTYPSTKIGGPSVNWVKEACRTSKKSVEMAKELRVPTLLVQAEKDEIVNLQPQNEFCNRASAWCRGVQIDDAYHELFIEKDEIRNKALTAIFMFFETLD